MRRRGLQFWFWLRIIAQIGTSWRSGPRSRSDCSQQRNVNENVYIYQWKEIKPVSSTLNLLSSMYTIFKIHRWCFFFHLNFVDKILKVLSNFCEFSRHINIAKQRLNPADGARCVHASLSDTAELGPPILSVHLEVRTRSSLYVNLSLTISEK